jgi:hypothetical protein
MTVNNYRITISPNTQQLNIPIQLDFDNLGKEQGFVEYEEYAINEVINPTQDFEVTRFPHSFWDENQTKTDINYNFYFFDNSIRITATTDCTQWINSYQDEGFTPDEIYYYSNSFKNSFFKLDFYDNKSSENQKIYFTVIIPTQQGKTEPSYIGNVNKLIPVNIKKPQFQLDYVGDKEGFFMYWLKNTDYLNISNFYMSCKFFNAKTGEFIRMMNECQGLLTQKFTFNKDYKFYYKCVLDYENYEYKMYSEDEQGNLTRVGTDTNPINWYEYVNPS